MNGVVFLVSVMAFGFAVAAIWARRLDLAEYHLMHGPTDGCAECEDK